VPTNTVKINNSDDFEWAVGDSKMTELIKWLEENGNRVEDHIPSEQPALEKETNMEHSMIFPCCKKELPAPLDGVELATCPCGQSYKPSVIIE